MITVTEEGTEVIEGHWKRGKLNGTVRRIGSNEGEDYIGTFKDGKKEGDFVWIRNINGEELEISKGQFKDDEEVGKFYDFSVKKGDWLL